MLTRLGDLQLHGLEHPIGSRIFPLSHIKPPLFWGISQHSKPHGALRHRVLQARRGTGFVQESELPPDDSQESAETSGIWGKPWVRAQGVLRILPTEWSVQNLANIEWRLLLINRRNSRSLG